MSVAGFTVPKLGFLVTVKDGLLGSLAFLDRSSFTVLAISGFLENTENLGASDLGVESFLGSGTVFDFESITGLFYSGFGTIFSFVSVDLTTDLVSNFFGSIGFESTGFDSTGLTSSF